MQEGWRYYNHALIPTTAPHEKCIPMRNKREFWSNWGGVPLFARWTTDFDCGYETEWWYVIKDEPFDINALKSKRRYEINKGNRNFYVKHINAKEYVEQLYSITTNAYEKYPKSYRPELSFEQFCEWTKDWDKHIVWGAFFKETDELCGYAWCDEYKEYVDFCAMKTNPDFEKYGINAVLVYGVIMDYNDLLSKSFYICDGARSTMHETNFQDYLEKYFGFRKAYCKLNIKYRFPFNIAIKIAYYFRNLIKTDSSIGKKLSTILFFESIVRS